MLAPRRTAAPRGGYTLIELLVVIAIIAVLIGLTSAAVMKFMGKGPEVQVRNDIMQLDTAIANFKTEFDVDYIPNTFQLRNNYTTASDALSTASAAYLRKVFGNRINLAATGLGDAQLNGNQCLVFFLGGIGRQGFSANAANPFAGIATPGETRKGPYFEFPANRLRTGSSSIPEFLDPWGTPFVYMTAINRAYNTSALNTFNMNVYAYCEGPTAIWPPKYINAHKCQIISAGLNKQLGTGSAPPNTSAAPSASNMPAPWVPSSVSTAGADDYSNFHDKRLGAP